MPTSFVIAVIFGCNIFYLVSLYDSIRSSVERDVIIVDRIWNMKWRRIFGEKG